MIKDIEIWKRMETILEGFEFGVTQILKLYESYSIFSKQLKMLTNLNVVFLLTRSRAKNVCRPVWSVLVNVESKWNAPGQFQFAPNTPLWIQLFGTFGPCAVVWPTRAFPSPAASKGTSALREQEKPKLRSESFLSTIVGPFLPLCSAIGMTGD